MAMMQYSLEGDVDAFVRHVDRAITTGSVTAKLEAGADRSLGGARMIVRAYERYSWFGGNRVALTLSILAVGTEMIVTAVATGGSQAMFFKINHFGEDAFLDRAVEAINSFVPGR
jgi:hypothetical protein